MESILGNIKEWFLGREHVIRIFAEHDSRVEGWFKGEMLGCLDGLYRRHMVDEFEREFTVGEKGWGKMHQQKIDFRIRIQQEDYLCELKAMCISQTYGTGRNLDFYFRENSSVGLWKDFRKLEALNSATFPWILSFVYPAPSMEKWDQTLHKWGRSVADWRCITSPEDYPEWLFIGCWQLRRESTVP